MQKGQPTKLSKKGSSQLAELPHGFEFKANAIYAYRDGASGDVLLSIQGTYNRRSLTLRIVWEYVTGNVLLAALWAFTLLSNWLGDRMLGYFHNGPVFATFVHISDYVAFGFDFLFFLIFQIKKLKELIDPPLDLGEPPTDLGAGAAVGSRFSLTRLAKSVVSSFFGTFAQPYLEKQKPGIARLREAMSDEEIAMMLLSKGYSEDMVRTLLR